MRNGSLAGKVFSLVGDKYVCLVSGAETGGAYAVFEAFVGPGNGSPPHIHHREDESFIVTSGELEVVVDGTVARLGPGDSLTGRRGIPHFFRNVGQIETRVIFTVTPAGFEEFLAEAGTPLQDRDAAPLPMDEAEVARISATAPKHGIELLAP